MLKRCSECRGYSVRMRALFLEVKLFAAERICIFKMLNQKRKKLCTINISSHVSLALSKEQ